VAGLATKLPVTILGGRFIASQLFGVHPSDPAILMITTSLLGCAALIAAIVPVRRTASIDPMRALRME
jgi:ABC-type antimicrobial peptide transport system permease subunit